MDRRFIQLVMIFVVTAIGYSILSSPGGYFRIDPMQLKRLLLYILLGASAYATYLTIRGPRQPPRPPGV